MNRQYAAGRPKNGPFPCPRCGHEVSSVKDSRHSSSVLPHVRRRRECDACQYRYTTSEVTDSDLQLLIDCRDKLTAMRLALHDSRELTDATAEIERPRA